MNAFSTDNILANGITATTISANTLSVTTYQNLPTDVRVTGASYSNNTFTFTNNTGGTFNTSFNSVTGLTVNGTMSATTISASTYLNFPFKYEDIASEFVSFLPFTYGLQNQAVTINIMYWIPVYIQRNLNIISVSIFIGTLSAGSAVAGLYDSDALGAPNNLLFQTTAFNNGVTSAQTYTLPTPQSINAGLYYVAFNSSSAANYRSVAATSYVNISSLGNANAAPYSRISKTFNYTGTLPATFAGVGGAASKGAVVNPHILFGISY